jgi:hypothetical protein
VDQEVVREHAEAHCAALLAGDIDRAATDLSKELRSNLGTLIGLMPLPLKEATIESLEQGGSGYLVVLRLVGESEETLLQTRWKERDGRPTIVEASHQAAPPPRVAPEEAVDEGSE